MGRSGRANQSDSSGILRNSNQRRLNVIDVGSPLPTLPSSLILAARYSPPLRDVAGFLFYHSRCFPPLQ
ncbi:hypothetical protein BDN70DRAFT_730090 [Pholiota conissans]|uniref:Uncharacterized protein n=1 Tax=Pholiota conissans TaxID=109636 RepID=A0A9P5YI05_9AGAR|nr:hypothetical protein BDN70DRAFT_730090 [Pholiota conissans]